MIYKFIKIKKRDFNFYNKNKGFVLLYATVISSIILAITLGVSDISLKEIKFSTSAKDTNNALFAADTGAECALYYDRSDINRFTSPDPSGSITCAGVTLNPIFSGDANVWSYNFTITNLGSGGQDCAKITINKDITPSTLVVSKGYNNGGSSCVSSSNTVERELDLTY